jgi:immunity repressor protein
MMKMVLNIKRVREEKGMTQEQLAEKANVNRSLLNQLETGKLKNTSINTLQKIADTLNCKIIELFI